MIERLSFSRHGGNRLYNGQGIVNLAGEGPSQRVGPLVAFVPPKLLRDNNPGPPASSKQIQQPPPAGLAGSGHDAGAKTDAGFPRLAVSNDRQAADLNAVTTIAKPGDH